MLMPLVLLGFDTHLHFISGTAASDLHFQAFLVEGLVRWNADRHMTATGRDIGREVRCYDGRTKAAVNKLAEKVLKKKLLSQNVPLPYTGNNYYVIPLNFPILHAYEYLLRY